MTLKYFSFLLLFALGATCLYGQSIEGKVYNKNLNIPLQGSTVRLTGSTNFIFISDTGGYFSGSVPAGNYRISISRTGYAPFKKDITVQNKDVQLGTIFLNDTSTMLDEVKIVEKIMAVVQKNDTTEYNSGAYKSNPDADAADMVKKMPGIELNGSSVKAQGEAVTKVLIDGKPFFGNDPYAALRTLPAEVIDKVQVYNEKSEQELFTGFSEGNTTKTINIITKASKRNGIFGKVDAGAGVDNTYSTDINLNKFDKDQRITVTGQSNNINVQNFTNQSVAGPAQALGTALTNAAGINYINKLGKKLDISGSYFFNETDNNATNQLQRRYLATADSGQLYNESNNAHSTNYSHRFNARVNYVIDSANSLLFQPQLSLQNNNRNNSHTGATTQADSLLNQTSNTSSGTQRGYNFSGNLLFRHKFKKAGRTFSLNITGSNNYNNSNTTLNALNQYYGNNLINDTLNQLTPSVQNTWNIAANAAYTEQVSKNTQLELQYTATYVPAHSDNNTYNYSYITDAYTLPDTLLSNTFRNRSLLQKAGGSYQVHGKKYTLSLGVYYQSTNFANSQFFPYTYQFSHSFQNLLPTASLQYKLSKTRNLQANYATATSVPGITQLQSVINNTDPLHLTTGNPELRQPYQHNVTLRYNATNTQNASNFYISGNASYTQHFITNSAIIGQNDTLIQQNILLPKGAQLVMPVNVDGNWMINVSSGYGTPIKSIKSNLNVNASAGLNHTPIIINSISSSQTTQNGGLNITLSSNISENIDFTIRSSCFLASSTNALNPNLNSLTVNETTQGNINIIFWKGFVYNTQFNYQNNSGLSAGYNQDYLLWNMSVGKKFGRKRLADIRILAYDILNQGTNIQHSINDLYIQDTHTDVLHRYFMLIFSYKVRSFKPA
ncbi:MAG: outer membrane beta-barrel protein [Flavipsychrobacter sp.]|nr:outer membrane beta-barrel protein [Flavipsychrobacter sp.]